MNEKKILEDQFYKKQVREATEKDEQMRMTIEIEKKKRFLVENDLLNSQREKMKDKHDKSRAKKSWVK